MKRCICSLLFIGCGNYDHNTCSWSGDGFTASHDCGIGKFCITSYTCPNGTQVDFQRCAGPSCQNDADCIDSHFCYDYSASNSYCMPLQECETTENIESTSIPSSTKRTH